MNTKHIEDRAERKKVKRTARKKAAPKQPRAAGVARTGLWPKSVELNDREAEVLTWVARGKTSAEIAQIVGLTKRTIDFHIDNARIKFGVATRIQAVIKAANGRLIEP